MMMSSQNVSHASTCEQNVSYQMLWKKTTWNWGYVIIFVLDLQTIRWNNVSSSSYELLITYFNETQFWIPNFRNFQQSNESWFCPSSIYSWSIGHILEHEFFCLGSLGSQGVDLRNSEQLFRVFFSCFQEQKKLIFRKR